MATFTTTIKSLVEANFDFGLRPVDYPIFDETYRGICRGNTWDFTVSSHGLNRKILDHYYYHEIGQETPDMFKFMLNRRMREIMPYYNQLYASEFARMPFDPFETLAVVNDTNVESDTSTESEESATSTGTGSSESKGRNVVSQFPQTMLNDSGGYASSATDSFSDASTTETKEGATTARLTGGSKESRILSMKGSQGSKSNLLNQFRQTILNIDLMVINDLGDLFFGLVNLNDQSVERRRIRYGSYGNGFWPYF